MGMFQRHCISLRSKIAKAQYYTATTKIENQGIQLPNKTAKSIKHYPS